MRTLLISSMTVLVSLLAQTGPAAADRSPIRRGAEGTSAGRRGEIERDRRARRPIEGQPQYTLKEQLQKEETKQINLITPPRCGARHAPRFRRKLSHLSSPSDRFYVEVWGNKRTFYTMDNIYYFLRSNRHAYVTMFWIGPEGSVFIPFANLEIEANRDHKIDPKNIIVEPVGLERWRVIATPKPFNFPCRGTDADFMAAMRRLATSGPWAAGSWDVRSKVRHRRRLRRRWLR